MIKKEYHTVNDFLEDASFKNWVLQNNGTDINFWEFWIANNSEKKALVNKAKELIIGVSFKQDFISKENVAFEWEKLETRIQQKKSLKSENKKRFFRPISIAASILLLITAGYFFNRIDKKIVHKTNYGEVLNIKLKDGSSVTLNANSSLSYYPNDSRKVWLSGEAYFQVDKKKTTNAKFWVVTNDLSVEVYGTTFNVNTKKKKTAVYLQEGNIWLKLKNGTDKKMLPGNYLTYSSQKDEIIEDKNISNAITKTSWKDGALIFENLPLPNAMEKIKETYGYNIVFKDNKSKKAYITGAVPNTNIDICLEAIQKSVAVKIVKTKNTLIISKK